MSRDDDFNFDNDDIFGGDDDLDDLRGFDDGFDLDDDLGGDDSFDNFGAEDDLSGLDDDIDFGGGDEYDEDFFDDEPREERSGPNRAFIILAAVMIIVFILALGLILFLATRDDGPNAVEQTRVAIEDFNATQAAFANQTATQSSILQTQEAEGAAEQATGTAVAFANETQVAQIAATQTQDALDSVTPTLSPEEVSGTQTVEAFLDPTVTPVPVTNTPEGPVATPTAQATSDTSDVAATATALALLFEDPTPTIEGGDPGDGVATAAPTTPGGVPGGNNGGGTGGQLPQTGFFDEPGGIGLLALIALALVGVIFGARRLRTASA